MKSTVAAFLLAAGVTLAHAQTPVPVTVDNFVRAESDLYMEQRCAGTMQVWGEPFTVLRIPKLFNMRTDPFERADLTSNTYWDWYVNKGYMIMAAQSIVAPFLATFKEFPPRQKAASFTIDQAMEKMTAALSSAGH